MDLFDGPPFALDIDPTFVKNAVISDSQITCRIQLLECLKLVPDLGLEFGLLVALLPKAGPLFNGVHVQINVKNKVRFNEASVGVQAPLEVETLGARVGYP